MPSADSILFWTSVIGQPNLLTEQIDQIPLDADSMDGFETVAHSLLRNHYPVLEIPLQTAVGELRKLVAERPFNSLQARGDFARLAYLLQQVPQEHLEDIAKDLVRSGIAVFESETGKREAARAALTSTSATGEIEPFYKHINELERSNRIFVLLFNANIIYVGQLVQKTEAELLAIKGFKRRALKEVKDILDDMGLTLGMRLAPEQFDFAKAETLWDKRRRRSVDHC